MVYTQYEKGVSVVWHTFFVAFITIAPVDYMLHGLLLERGNLHELGVELVRG